MESLNSVTRTQATISVLRLLINLRLFLVFVRPFYLSLLHGNFALGDDQHARQIVHAANRISDSQLARLLNTPDWRSQLTAAWFVGLTKRWKFTEQIANKLLAGQLGYAGQGYCVALGLIGGESCQEHLRSYLEKYLTLGDNTVDVKAWALGALAYINGGAPAEFLEPTLWDSEGGRISRLTGLQRCEKVFKYLHQHQMIA